MISKVKKICSLFIIIFLYSCQTEQPPVDQLPKGYEFLNEVCGIWGGPVFSGTSVGDFPDWQTDFRPISTSQVTAKNELNKLNDIFMGFFVGIYNNKKVLFFRNGGYFAGMQRVSYLVCDSAFNNSTGKYFRFSDCKAGPGRTRSEIIFRNDSMIFTTYVNNNFHFRYDAKNLDRSISDSVKTSLNYPQNNAVIDLSTVFDNRSDAVYYSFSGDPYPEASHPHLGITNLTYSFDGSITPDPQKKVIIIITAKPLFDGLIFNAANLKYRTRYVILNANETNFAFTFMHPGKYYINALYDVNGDLMANAGDYINFPFDYSFNLPVSGTANPSVTINFQVPF
ncbi:MAG: hypothetical protein N2167_00840 [Flavobacteriales bacterium]|nr:hypothetical protein [Flavobacteriales bacterium]